MNHSSAPATGGSGEIIVVDSLTKRYDDLVAVDAVSFEVRRGEVFGILGPNGAGKTTTLEMIEGLREPDGGAVVVDGYPVWPDPKAVKRRIGVQLQATALFDYQKLHEIVFVFGSCYGLRRSRTECVALLDRVGLADKADAYANQLSGGQKQRLSVALALVNDPELVFLDEPTTGLDPQARQNLWSIVRDLHDRGRTVLLTTHYMEEAEALCDRIAIMDHGRVREIGTVAELVGRRFRERAVHFEPLAGVGEAELRALPGVSRLVHEDEGPMLLYTADVPATIAGLLALADARGLEPRNLGIRSPSLEDVFLDLTGQELRP